MGAPQTSSLEGRAATYVPASALIDFPAHVRKISLGCPLLDSFLGGGIDHHGITEVVGEAGAGKSQLVLQLMLRVQLPHTMGGLGGGAIFLHSDSASYMPALNRLTTLAQAFARVHASLGATADRLMNQISVVQIDDVATLEACLKADVPGFLGEKPVRLIVLDSIGALFRTHGDDGGGTRAQQQGERTQQLFALAARLKYLSDRFNVAVVVTNQVTDRPLDALGLIGAPAYELGPCRLADGNSVRVPALGMSWSHCVNTRLILTRHEAHATPPSVGATRGEAGFNEWEGGGGRASTLYGGCGVGGCDAEQSQQTLADNDCAPATVTRRQMHVAWSPRLPNRSTRFEVRDDGVVGIAG